MNKTVQPQWLEWAKELQFIAQGGLTYSKDVFDIERFERIREIAAEMLSLQSEIPIEKVKNLFCNETGFQTPKLDTRAAIFKDDKILLVKEKNGTWSLPGGWVDINQSIKTNTEKEVKEEAGLNVKAIRIIAIQDRNLHNIPPYAYNVCKVFIKECLQSLLSRGYILGIVTSKTYQEYYSDFEPLGLADYFSTIVCADDTDEHKPQAAPLVAYLAKAHVSPENALYIGDSIYDIQCANNAGVDSGLVLWSNNVSNPIRADYYFKTPNDISKIPQKYALLNGASNTRNNSNSGLKNKAFPLSISLTKQPLSTSWKW